MSRDKQNREKQLLRCIPTILDYKSLLYIGARKGLTQMLNLFIDASYTIDILEIWPDNAERLKSLEGIREIVVGDVRNALKMNLEPYDVVMWWHGPEHVYEKELESVLNSLKSLANKFVVAACPWGINRQGKRGRNIHEEHVLSLYPEMFKEFGWKTDVIGNVDNKDGMISNLLAWSKT